MVTHGPKLAEQTLKAPSFSSGRDIQAFFRNNAQGISVDALKALRNQISVRAGEGSVSPQDSRLLLAKEWLELSTGAYDVFAVLERGPQPTIAANCLSILAALLTLTSAHFIYQPLAQPILKKLLTAQWQRKLDAALAGSNSELCLAALKLLNAVSSFAAGKEQKALVEAFSWDVKVFHKLLYMRRKGKNLDSDVLTRPDIRTLCLQFILSFISPSSSSHVKTMFLEQHRDILLSIFKGLSDDAHSVVRYTLEILWTNLWQDPKIKRTLKIGFFGETTIQHLIKLYERSAQEGSDAENIPADVVHHFLLAICTHRGVGICFADNGWYPRRESEVSSSQKGSESEKGKVHNKILANVLKMLKVNDDARQQELALKILRACPELVAGYLPTSGLTLEPRLSSKWLANVAFVGVVVALPVPTMSFYLPPGTAGSSSAPYQPEPPALSTIIENILPTTPGGTLKLHLSKALQAPSAPLVQHAAGLALAACLRKCEAVLDAFRTVGCALEEDALEGLWARRRAEVEREVRRRVPEVTVIIAFANAHAHRMGSETTVKSAMLAELAQRLLWMYHRCVPALVAEARYDLAKSLQGFVDGEEEGGEGKGDEEVPAGVEGLLRLQQLHVLRMLSESDQFLWNAKAAPSAPSNIDILLSLFFKTKHVSIRNALSSLLTHTLKDSLLFQHDPEEFHIWLDALPTSVRPVGSETPDGALLLDESECVVEFLDACMQRCAKTPHRYLEDKDALATDGEGGRRAFSVSPVMITMLEQLSAKMRSRSEVPEPSDALALTTFVRRVIVGLLGKQPDMGIIRSFAETLVKAVGGEEVFTEYPDIGMALRKECGLLEDCISRCSEVMTAEDMMKAEASSAVVDFVKQIEAIEQEDEHTAPIQAYELVDWVRLLDQPLSAEIVARVGAVIKRLHAPALTAFYLCLSPKSDHLWSSSDEDIISWVPLEWIILHSDSKQLVTPRFATILRGALERHRSIYLYKALTGLVMHRLDSRIGSTAVNRALEALNLLVEDAQRFLSASDFSALKRCVFVEKPHIQSLSCVDDLSILVTNNLNHLLELTMSETSDSDRILVSPICKYWATAIDSALERNSWQNLNRSLPWTKFMPFNELLSLTERFLRLFQSQESTDHAMFDNDLLQLVEALFSSLIRHEEQLLDSWLNQHLPAFLTLQKLLPTVNILGTVISRAAGSSIPVGCTGFRTTEGNFRDIVRAADMHWTSRLKPLPPNASVNVLLDMKEWDADISCAIASFIYRSSAARSSFWSWLSSGDLSDKPDTRTLAPAIHAFFDSSSDDELNVAAEAAGVNNVFNALAKGLYKGELDDFDTQVYVSCLALMVKKCGGQRKDFIKILKKRVTALSFDSPHPESLRLSHSLIVDCMQDAAPFVHETISHALQWIVRHLSENTDSADVDIFYLDDIADVIRLSKNLVAHFAEPVIAAAIKHHLCHSQSMRLAEVLFANVSLKPVSVNRHLQSILQHNNFGRLVVYDSSSEERQAVAKLLFTIFHTHPTNTCQPSHIQPLIQLYSGTLSSADRQLFAIFQLFEEQRKSSVAPVFTQWSQGSFSDQQTSLDAISNLDAARVLRTCLSFPHRRTAAVRGALEVKASHAEDEILYDPVFILFLFTQALAESPPNSALSWVSLYRTNTVSLVIRCLSSADPTVRKAALSQLGVLYKLMQTADMQEKEHVIYLLDLLRDQLEKLSENPIESISRLPSYTTLLLAHALRGIFYPSNFVYPLTARFLLQRPELDIQDVPMLYGMLYSSGDDWKKERGWMVRFLADGMLSSEDWRLLKRRHTWDLLASLFQGAFNDKPFRHLILEVLANLTCNTQATTSLLLKLSLVQWMEMQLLSRKNDESIAWAKIVENILVVIDFNQAEQATKGEWQAGLLRCLISLMTDADLTLLRIVSRAMARLGSGKLNGSSNALRALELALERLHTFETSSTNVFDSTIRVHSDLARESLPPYRSSGLHQLTFGSDLGTWGRIVESLFSFSMKHNLDGSVWDQLSSRLLLWRASCGEFESPLGEWVRKQTVLCLNDTGS